MPCCLLPLHSGVSKFSQEASHFSFYPTHPHRLSFDNIFLALTSLSDGTEMEWKTKRSYVWVMFRNCINGQQDSSKFYYWENRTESHSAIFGWTLCNFHATNVHIHHIKEQCPATNTFEFFPTTGKWWAHQIFSFPSDRFEIHFSSFEELRKRFVLPCHLAIKAHYNALYTFPKEFQIMENPSLFWRIQGWMLTIRRTSLFVAMLWSFLCLSPYPPWNEQRISPAFLRFTGTSSWRLAIYWYCQQCTSSLSNTPSIWCLNFFLSLLNAADVLQTCIISSRMWFLDSQARLRQ